MRSPSPGRRFGLPRPAFARALAAFLAFVPLADAARAAITERINLSSGGTQANADSVYPAISSDGSVVAFCSGAANLVSKDGNRKPDVFARERAASLTTLVSVSSSGTQGNMDSNECAVSADGRFVAFCSSADNLVPGDTNGQSDVFVRDRLTGVTERVSVNSAGEQGNEWSGWFPVPTVSISASGQFVAFTSHASNLVAGDTNGKYDVFVRDRTARTTERVSVSSSGAQGDDDSWFPSISAGGRYVAFSSYATSLVPGDTNGKEDVFVRDRIAGITERVSITSSSGQGNDHSRQPSISGDGRVVAFMSYANNLAAGDTGHLDVFIHNGDTGLTECVSVSSSGEIGNAHSNWPSISADGRWVAFASAASNLVSGDTNATDDVFVHDCSTGLTERVSLTGAGEQGNGWSDWPSISGDSRFVAFRSWASNLVPSDTNGFADIFVRDRGSLPPGLSINAGAACTNSTAVTLSITCGGWPEVRFRNDPGTWGAWEPCAGSKAWVLLPGDGIKRVCAQCRDASGNLGAEGCDEIVLDTAPPSGVAISINGGAVCADSPAVTLTLAAAGAVQMRFRNEAGAWSSWEPYATTKAWSLSAGRGMKTVGFQCRDGCGNLSAEATDTIPIPTFDDVACANTQWPYVEALVREGITAGCLANPPRYCPTAPVTRAQMAKFLCLAAGKTELFPPTPTFADVQPGPWYYGWVERLADPASWPGGIPPTSGCACPAGYPPGARCYCPNDPVTREQMAKFLCIATGHAAMPSCSGTFADVAPGWACPWIERLADPASWVGPPPTSGCACPPGYPGGARCYCPKENCTRAQMAKFLVLAFGIPL